MKPAFLKRYVLAIGIWSVAALLALNAARLNDWSLHLGIAASASQALPATVVPYTLLIRETSVLPDGTIVQGGRHTQAIRSDGASVRMLDFDGNGKQISQRHVVFASGAFATTDELRQLVAYSARPNGRPMERLRDPAWQCLRFHGGPGESI